ncbi:MAG: hypothetical protein ACXAC7_21590 [Candidatus Hodarchaeales archaeon]|jgi:hypothetical protein
METLDITVINTLNGKKDVVQADSNLTYGEIIKMNALAPPDVVWTVLDEDGNDISSLKLEERMCKAHIVPGRDIAGGK